MSRSSKTATILLTAVLLMSALTCQAGTQAAPRAAMSSGQAVTLGLVEGLTEYLPVSSTGHLYLTAELLGLNTPAKKEASDAYVIAIQLGAILAVFWLYFGRIVQMLKGLGGRDEAGRALLINSLVAFCPAVVIGLLCEASIKRYLFGLKPIVAAWLIGGLAILIVARRIKARGADGRTLEELGWRQALVIGLIQCIAMWPGVSRSLVTILGGVLVGLSVPAAVEFSFILGLATLGGATCYELLKEGPAIVSQFGLASPALGILVAFVSAVVAVKWMVAYLNRHGLEIFGYYRLVLGGLVLGLIATGSL